MMQFYKKRDFGALVSDTLNFFKLYGKNYFKNYLTLNGGIIILLVVVIVIGFGDFFKQAFLIQYKWRSLFVSGLFSTKSRSIDRGFGSFNYINYSVVTNFIFISGALYEATC